MFDYNLFMLLARRIARACFSESKKNDDVMVKDGRIFYDIPTYFTSSKFHYRINEEIPKDASDFSLKGLKIKHFEDTPDFNKIPVLHRGLNKYLDGKIYKGDMGFGKIPQVDNQIISQMSDYVPPSKDKKLLDISEK
jgi:hypothetical protein